jgi:hypothetical protein
MEVNSLGNWFEGRKPLWLKEELKDKIKTLGTKAETYDDIVERLILFYEKSHSPIGELTPKETQKVED